MKEIIVFIKRYTTNHWLFKDSKEESMPIMLSQYEGFEGECLSINNMTTITSINFEKHKDIVSNNKNFALLYLHSSSEEVTEVIKKNLYLLDMIMVILMMIRIYILPYYMK